MTELLAKGTTGKKASDGSIIYLFECPYCGKDFESTKQNLKPKTGRKFGKDHCGCQTYTRRATRVGIPPSNKLSDLERTVSQIVQSYSASAKVKGLSFALDKEFITSIVFKNCFYCGCVPNSVKTLGQGKWKRNSLPTNGIDKLNSDIGYTEENVVPCCTECNYFKSNISFENFCLKVHTISDNLRKQNM